MQYVSILKFGWLNASLLGESCKHVSCSLARFFEMGTEIFGEPMDFGVSLLSSRVGQEWPERHGTSIQLRKAYDVSNSFPLRLQTFLQLPFISWWIIYSWVIVHRWVDANVWFRRYPDVLVSICQTPSLYIYRILCCVLGYALILLSLSLSLFWFTHQRHKFHTIQHGPSD